MCVVCGDSYNYPPSKTHGQAVGREGEIEWECVYIHVLEESLWMA